MVIVQIRRFVFPSQFSPNTEQRAVDLKRSHAAKRGPANSTERAHYTRPVASTEDSLETVGEKKEDKHVAQLPAIILREGL